MTNIAFNADALKRLYLDALHGSQDMAEQLNVRRQPINEQIAALQQAFDDENAELITLLAEKIDASADYEGQLRTLAIDNFNETGTKTMDEHLGVQVRTKYVYDNAAAVEWALVNAPVMIQKTIDKKAFESLPIVADLPFVTTDSTVSAVIKGLK